MSEPGIRRAFIVIVTAILAAELFTQVLLETRSNNELWTWLIELTATSLSALFAVSVFEYQSRQTERDRQYKLLAALAAELQSNLNIISSEHRTPFLARIQLPGTTQMRYVKYAEAKLVPMPPVAAEAAIQSAVFDADDVYLLTRILRELHVHNTEVSYLSSVRSTAAPVFADAITFATNELDNRQSKIGTWCEELLEFLREREGIEVDVPPEPNANNGDSSN